MAKFKIEYAIYFQEEKLDVLEAPYKGALDSMTLGNVASLHYNMFGTYPTFMQIPEDWTLYNWNRTQVLTGSSLMFVYGNCPIERTKTFFGRVGMLEIHRNFV